MRLGGILRYGRLSLPCLALGILTPFSAPATAQVYLHSPSEEKRGDELVANLAKARDAHLAALDAHKAYLTELLAKHRTLTVQREIAQRDQFFTLLLSASARGQDPRDILRQSISADWSELTGQVATITQLDGFSDAAFDVKTIEILLSSLRRDRTLFIQLFERKAGKGSTYCDDKGDGTPTFGANDPLEEASDIRAVCLELAKKNKELARAYSRAGSASALLGDPKAFGGGMIAQAFAERREIDDLINAQAVISKAAKQQMDALHKYYQCELKKGGTLAKVSGVAAEVQKALDDLASGDRAKVFNDAALDKLLKDLNKDIPDCNAAAPAKDAPAAPDKGTPEGISAKQLISLIGNLDRYAAGDALLAAIQEQALDLKASKLSEALTGLATNTEIEQDTPTATVAAAAIRLFSNAEQIALAQSGRLPDTVGVLVALAEVRMRQATAKIEADRLAELKRSAGLKVVALRQRATMLSEANVALQPAGEPAFQMSLLRYASSWNQGAIPAAVANNDMIYGRYLPWAAREHAVVEASYAMLEPAAAQLQTYGQGGVTTKTIADLLHAAGLGAIAVTQ